MRMHLYYAPLSFAIDIHDDAVLALLKWWRMTFWQCIAITHYIVPQMVRFEIIIIIISTCAHCATMHNRRTCTKLQLKRKLMQLQLTSTLDWLARTAFTILLQQHKDAFAKKWSHSQWRRSVNGSKLPYDCEPNPIPVRSATTLGNRNYLSVEYCYCMGHLNMKCCR